MKIYVKCDSPLLKKCLEVFLKERLSSYPACDFVVCDKKLEVEKPIFLIGSEDGANLKKPFSKSKLLKALGLYYNKPKQETIYEQGKSNESEKPRASQISREGLTLERKVSIITEKFVRELLRVIKEHK